MGQDLQLIADCVVVDFLTLCLPVGSELDGVGAGAHIDDILLL